jgi:hypothetical protein
VSFITNQWVKMNPTEAATRLVELERENAALHDALKIGELPHPMWSKDDLCFQYQQALAERDEETEMRKELERENAALRGALDAATTSLCTISQQAGRTKELEEMSQIRGYAFSRYSAAIDAISAREGGAT